MEIILTTQEVEKILKEWAENRFEGNITSIRGQNYASIPNIIFECKEKDYV